MIFDPASKHLVSRKFKPGAANWEFTEVRSGLTAGEQVVTSIGRKDVKAGVLARPDDGIDDE